MDVAHANNLLVVADALAREKECGHRGRRRKNRISGSTFGVEAGNARGELIPTGGRIPQREDAILRSYRIFGTKH
jgi:hypothetical protein